MSTHPDGHVLERHWFKFLPLGALTVALGAFAVGRACLTTLTVTTVWLFGCPLIAGGVAEIISSSWAERRSGGWFICLRAQCTCRWACCS